MAPPLVTLALPAFNEEKQLEKTVRTLLAQTFTDFELILGDNCSADGTMQIMQRLAAEDPRIRISKTRRNLGAVKNFSRLRFEARGKYFAWIGAHDAYRPEWLEELVKAISADERIVMVYPFCEFTLPDGEVFNVMSYPCDSRVHDQLSRVKILSTFPASGTRIYGLYRTRAVQQCPLDICIRWDTLFLAQLSFFGDFVSVNKPLWSRHFHEKPLSRPEEADFHQALARHYRTIYQHGAPLNPLHWLPTYYHLYCLARQGLLASIREGLGRLRITAQCLRTYQKKNAWNVPHEKAYFRQHFFSRFFKS